MVEKNTVHPGSPDFSAAETRRYARNILLPEVGWAGQRLWRSGRVLVVGAGGIGSAAIFYLAAAGVGQIGIADGDTVEISNLQRQILHRLDDLGRRKVESAREAVLALNPHCRVETCPARLEAANIRDILPEYDIILDASDNFPTRLLVADCCWQEKVPLVSAAAAGFQGLLLVVDPGQGSPCYRCLLPQAPQTSPEEGILGAVAGVMGSLQAAEALKLLLGRGSELADRLLSYDGLKCRFHYLQRTRALACPLCGGNPGLTGREAQAPGEETEPGRPAAKRRFQDGCDHGE
jgi:adenylyltransferase/sulfurtransferase